jgi:hypothetical protein
VKTQLTHTEAWTKVQPKVLVATTSSWVPTARLMIALDDAGCIVEALCPAGHPVNKTNALRHSHIYRGLAPLMSLKKAIVAADPDLVIPGDDLATRHLHDLYRQERRSNAGTAICKLIERSLGASESFPVVFARNAFMQAAHQEGVRVPKTTVVENGGDLKKAAARFGFPLVLKADGTSGGNGVRIAQTFEEAERALRTLQAPPVLARATKRAIVDHDTTLLWPSLLRHRFVVNAQALVHGREATSTVFCWKGSVLAALHFEVLEKMHAAGHAAVLRLIDHWEMSVAVEKMAKRLNLSGFYGFDFIREADSDNAYLIEVNPRTTQVGHLALGPGRDLPAALYAAVAGDGVPASRKITEADTIALFPQEWIRDPGSEFLQSAYHDVPWDQLALVSDCIRKSEVQRAWYAKQNLPALRPSSQPLTVSPKHAAVEVDCEAK